MSILLNEQPTNSTNFRLAIIGEAPFTDDVAQKKCFSGSYGRFLNVMMQKASIPRTAIFAGHICQSVPPNGSMRFLDWDGPEIQQGMEELRQDLAEFSPNCCLLLGDYTLKAAGINHKLTNYRGSLFKCLDATSPFFGYKCISTYSPKSIMKNYDWKPFISFDLRRAKAEAEFPELRLPEREFEINLTSEQIISKLQSIEKGTWVSIDIEGGIPNPEAAKAEYRFPQGVTCVSVSTHPLNGFIINIVDFVEEEKLRIFKAFYEVLCSEDYPKVLQNSLYDNFVLSWLWRMPIRNVVWDTMLSGWEIYPELPKSLAVQTSIWTKEPYYKFERKADDKDTHYLYCCKDSAVTLEIAQAHQKSMNPAQLEHFNFNMSLLPAIMYMEMRGINYDAKLADYKLAEVTVAMSELQARINSIVGHPLNPNSPLQMKNTLYKEMGFEPQYKIDPVTRVKSLTADVDALLTLLKKYESTEELLLYSILKWRMLEGQRKQLEIKPDADGRVRASYNIVGSDTGRFSCSMSPTGNGANLQTITKKLRGCYRADPGKMLFQCDLSGADGWTVAAWSNALGDSTMLDDYNFGIKPARVIAAMRTSGAHISRLSQRDLKTAIKSIDIPEWLYFTCKRVQHGSNYELGDSTMSDVIMKDSWKLNGDPIYTSSSDCRLLKGLYKDHRYKGVKKWQDHTRDVLQRTGRIPSASGHIRPFFGRLQDHNTYRTALSQEPQINTSYVTNLALRNLWYDEENRDSRNHVIIEPLHQVHDALIGQFPFEKAEWALDKIRQWFNNQITIAKQQITIPFEGNYGPSWGEQPFSI